MMPGRPQLGSAVHKAASMLALDDYDAIYKTLLRQNEDGIVLRPGTAAMIFEQPEAQIRGLGFSEGMMIRDALFYLPGDILVKVDRASMAYGLEARAPLLDRRIYEFCWGLPMDYKIRDGQGKWLLRALLKRHVPPALFERPKQGFNMPVAAWLRGALRPWAESLLDERLIRQQGLLDANAVTGLWQAHQAGRGNHAGALWTILMFQAWHQRWL
jgi:asparagine synthase (glutamine-hydrolysing)